MANGIRDCEYMRTSFFTWLANPRGQFCYLAMIAYLLSRIIILYGHGFRALTAGKDMMLLFAITGLVLLVLTFICSIRCYLNFGHGLKAIITGKSETIRDSHNFHSIGGNAPFPVESTKRRLSLV